MSAEQLDLLITTVTEAARRAVERGDWAEAGRLAERLLEVRPDDPAARELLVIARRDGRGGSVEQGRRHLTVLFADLVGSTALSERLDLEEYLEVLTTYRECVRQVVEEFDGHVDQYQGDGVVAYFGFPQAAEDDPIRAVEAGLEIVRRVPDAGAALAVDLGARIGVHTGPIVVTSSQLGARDRDTAVGFATNVAARIQGLAAPGEVVVSEAMVEVIAPHFELDPLGERSLKGVSEEMNVFVVGNPRTRSTVADDRHGAPLVGRERERGRLDVAWSATVEEGPDARVVTLTGDPGIGKSRLVRAAVDRASAEGGLVVEVNCGRDFRHVGMGAMRRAVEKSLALGNDPDPEAVVAALRGRADALGLSDLDLAALRTMMGVAGPEVPALAPDRLRGAMIEALIRWISLEAAQSPLVLVVEDLQWADDRLVDVVAALTRAVPPGLMVLATARPGGIPDALRSLEADAVVLAPLHAEAVDLVAAFAGPEQLAPELAAAIAERSEGVPLFVEHLVISTLARGELPGAELPSTLESLLQSRLDASGSGRALAEIAAVAGRGFTVELIETVIGELGDRTPLRTDEVPGAVRALTRAGLVEGDDAGELTFRHALVVDVAYEMQLRSERPVRHRAVADAIVARHGFDAAPEALAVHYERAGDPRLAATASLRAAELAAGLAEYERVFAHLDHAAAMIEQLDGRIAERLDLARSMQLAGALAASQGYAGDAVAPYLRALELCDRLGGDGGEELDTQLVGALAGLWSKEVVVGDLRAAGAVTERIERLIPSTQVELAPELRRFVLHCRGFEQMYAGANSDAVRLLTASSELPAGPVPVDFGTPHDYTAGNEALRSVALTLAGDDAGAETALANALRRADELRFPVGPFSRAVVQVYGSYRARLRGDREDAIARALDIVAIGDRHGFMEHAVLGQVLLLAATLMEPDLAACDGMQNLLGMWRMAGGGLAVPVLLGELAEGFLRVDEPGRAAEVLEDARALMEQTGQRGVEPELHRLGALVGAASGWSHDAVTAELVKAASVALASGSVLLAARALRDVAASPMARVDAPVLDLAAQVLAVAPAGMAERSAVEAIVSGVE